MQIIKVGGHEVGDLDFLTELARCVSQLEEAVILVHGGGKEITDMQSRLGLETAMVDGLRVTDTESLKVTQMVLSGYTNKTIVAALLEANVDAVGVSGVDGGLLRCEKRIHPECDLGYVGRIVDVRKEFLERLVALGHTPVVSPVSIGWDGWIYNVNADEAAVAIAVSIQASSVSFVSNVAGVLDEQRQPVPWLSRVEAKRLIEQGVITKGMLPKVLAALDAIAGGVTVARIVNLEGLGNGDGTVFAAS